MNGYAAAFHALTSRRMSWPGIEDLEKQPKPKPLDSAMFLPDRICRAFAAADPEIMNAGVLGETNLHPPESDRAAFEQAKADATRAARKLIEVALSDPDGILGPYLNGLPRAEGEPGSRPWSQFSTPVEGLMLKRPDVFRAAIENEQAMQAVWDAGQNDPWQKNIRNMMEIAQALFHYSSEHEGAFPDSLEALLEPGHRKQLPEAKSLLTGRPYVYVAAGEKCPSKFSDRASFILLYDDEAKAGAYCACVFGTGGGGAFPVSELKEQLRRRSKENFISASLAAAG